MTTQPAQNRPLLGVLLVAVTVLLFAIGDVLAKYLMARYPVPLVVAVRYLSAFSFLLAVFWPRQGAALFRTQRTGLVLARGLVLSLATMTMGLALQLMPVGETVAILYLSPFAVMLLAGPLLGERVSSMGWIGALFGFAGVLLVLRPGGGLDSIGVIWALINAGLATAFHLLTRTLSRTETPLSMLIYATMVGSIFSIISVIASVELQMPSLVDFGLMVIFGGLSTFGHFLFSLAYREGPASLLAPVNYLHLVWAGLLSWLVFDHLPDGLTLFGIVLICSSGAAIAVRAHLDNAREVKSAGR